MRGIMDTYNQLIGVIHSSEAICNSVVVQITLQLMYY